MTIVGRHRGRSDNDLRGYCKRIEAQKWRLLFRLQGGRLLLERERRTGRIRVVEDREIAEERRGKFGQNGASKHVETFEICSKFINTLLSYNRFMFN